MMSSIKGFTCLLMLLALLAPLPAHAAKQAEAAQAEATVQAFYTQLTDAMKEGDRLGFAGRYKKLAPAIRAAFDLPLMTRRATGLSWDNATPQEQADLVAAFSEFSVASYASQFADYNGEKFSITGEKRAADGSIMVETTLTPKDGSPIALNYLMQPDNGGPYRIVDVYLNGAISQMAARRAEFSSIARRDGIPALARSLDEKSKQMGPS